MDPWVSWLMVEDEMRVMYSTMCAKMRNTKCCVHKSRKLHTYGYSVQESTVVWESVFVICRR